MPEEIIYFTYTTRNKQRRITDVQKLPYLCNRSKEDALIIHQSLLEKGFTFHHSLKDEPISFRCRLCSDPLRIFDIDESLKKVFLTLHSCNVKSPLVINKQRFSTIFEDLEIDEMYERYCHNKMRKWTTEGIPVASLEFKIKKYGEEEGKLKYDEFCKSIVSTSLDYFKKKGLSGEEAAANLKERQATFSLKKCIKKYGEEEGKQKWAARQARWQMTLNSKTFEEIERINQDKVWKSGNVSKVSQKLFEHITVPGARWGNRREGNCGEKLIILDDGTKCLVDFSMDNKLIEFFGDFWHANPLKHNPDEVVPRRKGTKTALEIWEEDFKRISLLKKLGYHVMVVWEHDFTTNPDEVIEKCKKFLSQ